MRRFISGAVALLFVLSFFSASAEASSAPPGAADRPRAAAPKTVTTTGWGGLRIGMTRGQTWRTGMVSHRVSACDIGYDMRPAYRKRGVIIWNGASRLSRLRVSRLLIFGTTDRTPRGAGVGTTLRQLRQLYPGLTPLTQDSALDDVPGRDKKDLWVVSLKKRSGTLNFQFAYGTRPGPGAKVERMLISRKQEVYWGC